MPITRYTSRSVGTSDLLTWLESLNGHGRGVVPDSLPHLPELTVAELLEELEAVPVDLPLVPRVVTQVRRHGLLDLNKCFDSNII